MNIEENEERKKYIEIDLSNIQSYEDLHKVLKEKLGFPKMYGMNWDAFWDAITGLVDMPENLVLVGWDKFEKVMPRDAKIMKRQLYDLNEKYPSWACNVAYR